MEITVNAVHFNADLALIDFIKRKLNKLETFYDRITSSEVFLRLEKGDKVNTHKKLIEVKLNVPGNTLFVKEEGDTFEEATDKSMDVLTRRVKRFKQKHNEISHFKPEPIVSVIDEE